MAIHANDHGVVEPLEGPIATASLVVGVDGHEAGVVLDLRDVIARHILRLVFSHPESQLTEPVSVVHAMEEGGSTHCLALDILSHPLVQEAMGQSVPLLLSHNLVDSNFLEV